LSRGTGEEGIFGLVGWSGSPILTSLCVSSQWLVPLEAGFGCGGTERGGVSALLTPGPVLAVGGGVILAAIFSFRAFCRQSGQVISLAFADWNHLPHVLQRIFVLPIRILPCSIKNDVTVRRNALLSIGVMGGFVYPWFFGVTVSVGVNFCPDVCNDGYLNVPALLLKKGDEGASDQVFMVLGFGHFALIA
jgi:hypothetical protein